MAGDKGGLKGWLAGPKPSSPKIEPGGDKPAPLDRHRIVVLPMSNISPDPQDNYFAEGITDELISTISKIRELHVIARTSSMKYKDSGKRIAEICQELRTGSVLEGTVRKAGNRLRVTAQLVDPQSEESLWSESYDRELGDAFAIQSDIARNVAEGLKIQLHTGPRQIQRRPTENAEAYGHYLKGRHFFNIGTQESFVKAIVQFEIAVKSDPGFALGYAGLADTYLLMGRQGYSPPSVNYPKAIEFATKAIGLDGTLAEPYAALAAIRQEYEWKWEEAETGFKRAIELNPSYATAHAWYGLYLGHLGRFERAIDEAKRAIELDPLSQRMHTAASEEYLFAHQYDKAIEEAESMMEIVPEYGGAYGYRAYAEVEMGMYDDAIADFREAGKRQGARAWMGRLGHAYGVSGRTAEARAILNDLEAQMVQPSQRNPFLPPPPDTALDFGLVYLGLGDNQLALDWFEKAVDERTAEMIHLKYEPIYARIQGEPRLKALLKKIGLDR